MTKQDLTLYSEDELSLQVYNTESLYIDRNKPNFAETLDEMFVYTTEQKQKLDNDMLEEVMDEYQNG